MFRTLFCTENNFKSRPMKTLLSAKNDKAKFDFCKFFEFAFIATIDKQQDLGQLTNKCSQDFILYWKQLLPLFPRPMKTLLSAKMKSKIRLCKFFEFGIYSRLIDKQDLRQLTNKCSQELYFVLKTTAIISDL
jgi:hypothetical protein